MKPNIVIIPGFNETDSDIGYVDLKNALTSFGTVFIYNPVWQRTISSDWIEGLEKYLQNTHLMPEDTILVGFSMGAYISLFEAEKEKFKHIFLCSLSPYFKETTAALPHEARDFMGKKRMADFSAKNPPEQINSPASFFFGDKDWQLGVDFAKNLSKKYNSAFVLISNTGHELTENYIKEIARALGAALAL